MKLNTSLEFSAPEIESAIMRYARAKTKNPDDFYFHTRIMWRSRKAVVEVRRKVPTLNDKVKS